MSWLPSPEFADWWYDISWKGIIGFGAAAAFAAAATVMFTVLQFWSGGIIDGNAEARNKVMELHLADARGETAKAHERAAILEKENLLIRERIAGRRLSKEQHDTIGSLLSNDPTTFDLNTIGEGEAGLYASDIVKALSDAGWSVRNRNFPLHMMWEGLSVSLSDDTASLRLLSALQAAGISVSWFTEKSDIPTIWVGSKPSPF